MASTSPDQDWRKQAHKEFVRREQENQVDWQKGIERILKRRIHASIARHHPQLK